MKTLVIPDIHLEHKRAERLIAKVRPSEVVFLGDYFDRDDDDELETEATARWLSQSLQKLGRCHLIGNHDTPYMAWAYPEFDPGTTGWTTAKQEAVSRFMKPEDWRKLRFHYYAQGWLLTHAGLSADAYNDEPLSVGFMREREIMLSYAYTTPRNNGAGVGAQADEDEEDADEDAEEAKLVEAVTGPREILWCDNPLPIPGVKQIRGHVRIGEPSRVYRRGGVIWSVDTGLNHVVLIEDGVVTTYKNYE